MDNGANALVLALIITALYFLPTAIAGFRHHHNSMAIFVLNLTVGWLALPWIIALVWAFTSVRPEWRRA